MRTIKPLSPDLTNLLFQLGPRILVLVEGDDDVEVFREWYGDKRGEVEFFPAGGNNSVEARLWEVLNAGTTKRAFGIIDRDFRPAEEIIAALQDPNARLFILSRFTIENYLLEPEAVFEELRVCQGSSFSLKNVEDAEKSILEVCKKLSLPMAANWIFFEAGQGLAHYKEGHDLKKLTREDVVRQIAQRIGCDEIEAERKLTAKESFIKSRFTDFEAMHTYINGKHLLFQIHNVHIINRKIQLERKVFRRLLTRAIKEKVGMHADIQTIVEKRILGFIPPSDSVQP